MVTRSCPIRAAGCERVRTLRRRDPPFIGLAEAGSADLGAMVSRRITLAELNRAFRAMREGEVIRSVIA